MKTRLSLPLVAAVALTVVVSAQSVVIKSKKVTYKRPKPMSNYKRTFTINYPKIKAATPALSRKIENAISYNINIKEEKTDVQWLEEADYKVGYNQNGIFSIALTTSGSAAYPSGDTQHVVIDLKTGSRVRPADVFTNLPGVLKLVEEAKDKEVARAIVDIKKHADNGDIDAAELFEESAKYQPIKLDDFSVGKHGVTFYHDYGFPHVALALQPPGEFMFSWKQLRSYIKPGGLLARIAR